MTSVVAGQVPDRVGAAQSIREITMVQIDHAASAVAAIVRDKYLSLNLPAQLQIVDGSLWQTTPINIVRRDLESGEALATIDKPPNTWRTYFGFGSIWLSVEEQGTIFEVTLHRIAPTSGRTVAEIPITPRVRDIAFGRSAIHVLTREGEILEIDPVRNVIVDSDPVRLATVPDALAAVGGALWICECEHGRITRFDPEADSVLGTHEFEQRGFVLPDPRQASQGPVSVSERSVWLLDGVNGTLTRLDASTGEAGRPVGIPRGVEGYDFGIGSLWLAAGEAVHRIDTDTGHTRAIIDMPSDFYAGWVALDEATGLVWASGWRPDIRPVP